METTVLSCQCAEYNAKKILSGFLVLGNALGLTGIPAKPPHFTFSVASTILSLHKLTQTAFSSNVTHNFFR